MTSPAHFFTRTALFVAGSSVACYGATQIYRYCKHHLKVKLENDKDIEKAPDLLEYLHPFSQKKHLKLQSNRFKKITFDGCELKKLPDFSKETAFPANLQDFDWTDFYKCIKKKYHPEEKSEKK